MYQAKAKGKGRYEFFDPAMAAAMLRRHDLKEELAKAIDREEIFVDYQPIVSLETGRISAAEALVRWQHPVRGAGTAVGVHPARRRDGADPGDRRVRPPRSLPPLSALAGADADGPPVRLHVNLSAAQLRDPDLIAVRSLDPGGVRPHPWDARA